MSNFKIFWQRNINFERGTSLQILQKHVLHKQISFLLLAFSIITDMRIWVTIWTGTKITVVNFTFFFSLEHFNFNFKTQLSILSTVKMLSTGLTEQFSPHVPIYTGLFPLIFDVLYQHVFANMYIIIISIIWDKVSCYNIFFTNVNTFKEILINLFLRKSLWR